MFFLIGPNVARCYPPSSGSRSKAIIYESGTYAFPKKLEIKENIKDFGLLCPKFFEDENQFAVKIEVETGSTFYGGGEQPTGLCLNGRQFLTWNADAYRYSRKSINLYQSHPFVMGVRSDGTSFGVIADSTFPLSFDIQDLCITIQSKASKPVPFSLVLIDCDSPQSVVSTLASLTGYMALPPKWSLGYQQCRWSYYPDSRAIEVAQELRKRKIPCDVIWFDIHYMNQYRIFTFDPKTFPNPKKVNDQLHSMGYHSVWMIDPGIKQDENYFVYKQAMEKNLCVLTEKKEPFIGNVWPGPCVFPDFTLRETCEWWANLYPPFLANGIDGIWNDMNEPAVFDRVTKTMDIQCIHKGTGKWSDVEELADNGTNEEGVISTHERYHNVYGISMARASLKGMKKAQPDKRPFLLTRSNFLGGQRYAATWTGDNTSDWDHLSLSIPMVLNLGLSGQPFSGPDIGGFFDEATPELWARWIGFGALFPFSRGHTHEGTIDHEPYAFGPHTEEVARVAIGRRYRLMQYLYTVFREASVTGLPILRPLFFVDPKDPALRNEDKGFMIGEHLAVLAQVDPIKEIPVNLPKNSIWYDISIDEVNSNIKKDLPLLKLRGGGIIPLIPLSQYVDEKPIEELTLLIGLDQNGEARGEVYHDAGNGYGYQNGQYLLLSFFAKRKEGNLLIRKMAKGNFTFPASEIPIHFVTYDGNKIYKESALCVGPNTEISLSLFPKL